MDADITIRVPRADDTARGGTFPATRWSVVMRAQQHGEPGAPQAMAALCEAYWKPVYVFLRRQGNARQDAEDLTQGFFAMLLRRDALSGVDESKGRLRSFLLTVLKRFAANEHERASALKRGGGAVHLSLDVDEAEQAFAFEPVTDVAPDVLFERQWALALLDQVLNRLRTEYARDGRSAIFDALKDRLSADGDERTLAQTADALGMNEAAVKVAVFRMRQRYRRLLHEEIERTVESPREVNDEIAHLFQLFARRAG